MDISEKVAYWLDIADYDMINKEKSSSILKRTEDLFKWLKSKLR